MSRSDSGKPPVVYLDDNADAPVSPAAWRAFREASGAPGSQAGALPAFGNPSSAHALGREARRRLDAARAEVARALGGDPAEIVFTSGGTEADALAILGILDAPRASGSGGAHVVTTVLEHAAAARNLEALERRGRIRVTRVPAGRDGRVDAAAVVSATRAGETVLVTMVLACSETGVLQPVAEVARALGGSRILLHADAVQAAGRMRLDVRELGVDLLSVSGHKAGAVAGSGALFVREGVRLEPLVAGGGQEGGRRASTESVACAASLAAALGEALGDEQRRRLAALRDRLESELLASLPGVEVIGAGTQRLCNTSCVRFAGCEADALLAALDLEGIRVSAGSACCSGTPEPAAALLGMGLSPAAARECVRFSLPRTTTHGEIDRALEALRAVVPRALSLRG